MDDRGTLAGAVVNDSDSVQRHFPRVSQNVQSAGEPVISVDEALLIDDRVVDVVQGDGPGGVIASLSFDQQSGLLVRLVRYSPSPIGRVPTQVDYSDYRDVNGIKMPFRFIFSWLDGRDTIELSQVQLNVPVDAAKFGKPNPLQR